MSELSGIPRAIRCCLCTLTVGAIEHPLSGITAAIFAYLLPFAMGFSTCPRTTVACTVWLQKQPMTICHVAKELPLVSSTTGPHQNAMSVSLITCPLTKILGAVATKLLHTCLTCLELVLSRARGDVSA
eukprot:CAMPEP_0115375896 /NCGR_PEP_ID=MMETSP0271-20121206/2694_1 /TAXON_ID=71861 /ORGANISM="Scrippsiella trochoidea, Strain CCMP3099" /LENGTH=128 /DNA_ID=CAMNT_0002798965 /DNA_START=348 /DNA_END=734 /DNA_ORIENTATION=-